MGCTCITAALLIARAVGAIAISELDWKLLTKQTCIAARRLHTACVSSVIGSLIHSISFRCFHHNFACLNLDGTLTQQGNICLPVDGSGSRSGHPRHHAAALIYPCVCQGGIFIPTYLRCSRHQSLPLIGPACRQHTYITSKLRGCEVICCAPMRSCSPVHASRLSWWPECTRPHSSRNCGSGA